jgi:hypothetical protein
MIFLPKANDQLNVTLPGEILRALVTRVVNQDTVIVEIGQPMTRSHSFRLGDLVACRRTPGMLGETWQAIEDRPNVPDPVSLAKAAITKPSEKPLPQVSKPSKQGKTGVKAKTSVQPAKPQCSVGKR